MNSSTNRFALHLARVLSAISVGLVSSQAHAEKPTLYLAPGPLYSYTGGSVDASAFGAEISTTYWPSDFVFLPGAFVQAEGVLGDHGHTRFAGGLQGAVLGFVGLELGVYHRTKITEKVQEQAPQGAGLYEKEVTAYRATTGIHIAPYWSLALFGVGFRLGVPVQTGDKNMALEGGLAITLKFPYPIIGDYPRFGSEHGRPLLVNNQKRVACLRSGTNWGA